MKTNKPILLVTATLEFMPDLKIEIQKKFKLIYKNQASYLDTMKILNKFKVEAWICNPCPTYEINSLLISKCKSLKVVATPSTGINHFSKEIFQIKNLKIFSLKDSTLLKSIKASSEYTFISYSANSALKALIADNAIDALPTKLSYPLTKIYLRLDGRDCSFAKKSSVNPPVTGVGCQNFPLKPSSVAS